MTLIQRLSKTLAAVDVYVASCCLKGNTTAVLLKLVYLTDCFHPQFFEL